MRTPPKQKRIPRRGPGVAELEKILQEQEGQDISSPPPPPPPPPPPSSLSAFVFRQHHLSPSISSLNPPPPPPPPPLSFLPPYDFSSWPHLPSFPPLDVIPPAMPTAADAAEKALFPIRTRISDLNFPSHFVPSLQFSASTLNLESYNSPVNFIPGSASSCPAATSSAARNFHQIEHPSSQRSVDFNNIWTSPEEQEKMLSAKRQRPLMDERHRDFDNRRIPIFSNMPLKDSSSSSSSSLEMNRTALNLDSNLRGTKRGLNSGSFKLAEESNLMGLGSSSSTPNEFPPFDFRQPQETMEALQHRDDQGGSGSDYNKITFNSSLYESNSKSKGSIVAAIGPEAKPEPEPEPEPEGEGIDLDLKL